MKELPAGLYELLYTKELNRLLNATGQQEYSLLEDIDPKEIAAYLSIPLARELAVYLQDALCNTKASEAVQKIGNELRNPVVLQNLLEAMTPIDAKILTQIREQNTPLIPVQRPDTRLSESALLTGSARTPSLQSQLSKELASCIRADWIVSFIKFTGVLQLLPALKQFTRTPLADGSPRLRIATTSYMGATDINAIRLLQELPNTELRMSLDTKRTRLHAKAYLFHRETGFSTAYIGSANVSKAAMNEGLEWTIKVSEFETQHLWQHAIATFDSHWEDETEFVPCTQDTLQVFAAAIQAERGTVQNPGGTIIPLFQLRPYGFQQIILDEIAAEREAGKHQHLIIAATGTGKTMVAAFDYLAFCKREKGQPRVLFVAHREEILKQALQTFRHVLQDGNFGELLAGGSTPSSYDHLFCTVQSWNSRNLDTLARDYFDYVVLDEAHHGTASTYQKLLQHIEAKSLLGLTATPERSDGGDIRNDFGGSFTHELRLTEAIERSLLAPFHYYGIPDAPGIDLSAISWRAGKYDMGELSRLLETNDARAQWVLSQTLSHVADISQVRGLGFCVSITHAHYMAKVFSQAKVPAVALTSGSPKQERDLVQRQLKNREIQCIFTVDLYNEGVDIPFVDTVLFLRPTESLTIFLQQLGRGLRLHEEKAQLTVLDFIAPQNKQFSFIARYRSLSMRPGKRIDTQLKAGMPFVPTGCFVHLERQAEKVVLDSIRNTTRIMQGRRFYQELERLVSGSNAEHVTLQELFDWFHVSDPDDIYRRGLPSSFVQAVRTRKGFEEVNQETYSLHEGFRRLLLADDPYFFQELRKLLQGEPVSSLITAQLHALLWHKQRPGQGDLDAVQQYILSHKGVLHDLLELLDWLDHNKPPIPKKQFAETGNLNLHASYSRSQILLALGKGTFEDPFPSREGVLYVPEKKIDVFFADINKSEADFSPTTMYEDYAITHKLFHWQSQSGTSEATATGQRYIHHAAEGCTPYLFIRKHKKSENKVTAPYVFAGPLQYTRHQGAKPMSIIWELKEPLPARVLSWARRVG